MDVLLSLNVYRLKLRLADLFRMVDLARAQGLESVATFIWPSPLESYHLNRWANLIRETEDNSLLKGLI